MYWVTRKSYLSFWFCFANMLNYGTSSVLWAPFSLKTLLEESSPGGARLVQKTVENAGKLLRIRRSRKQRDRCWPLIQRQAFE